MPVIRIHYFSDDLPRLQKTGKGDWIDLYAAQTMQLRAGDFALIPLGVFVADGAALIGAAVLNQHQLKVRKCLAQNAVNTIIQVFFRPVNRDNNADYRHFSHPSLLHSRSSRCHRIAAG